MSVNIVGLGLEPIEIEPAAARTSYEFAKTAERKMPTAS